LPTWVHWAEPNSPVPLNFPCGLGLFGASSSTVGDVVWLTKMAVMAPSL
jgi:hypothetical protein